jgi:hypothetical protein
MKTNEHSLAGDPATALIRARTEDSVRRISAGGAEAIHARLAQLDAEWDIDRVLAAGMSGAVAAGAALGMISSRKWYLLPLVAGGFMLQHAIQGKCPPVRVLRHMGVRTTSEIDEEHRALCAMLEATNDIPAQHVTHPTKNDYVETASGRIKPASQS